MMKKLGFGLFAAGVLFGTAGIKILSSKDARKLYAHTTAAALRAKDTVMAAVREGAYDVYAEAKALNNQRAEEEADAVVEDASEENAPVEENSDCDEESKAE